MAETEPQKEQLTQAELDAINKHITDAKSSLVSKETAEAIAKAREQAKRETEAELATKKKLEELERTNAELQSKLQAQEKTTLETIDKLQAKVNDLVGSRAVVNSNDPFVSKPGGNPSIGGKDPGNLTDDEVSVIEESSARAFFGPAWDPRG